jgi:hypothetical protein
MVRPLGQIGGGTDFDQLAQIHDRYPVGHPAEQSEFMGDQKAGKPALLSQREHQVRHFDLRRGVEAAPWLVGNQHPRFAGERAGERHPLAFSSGQLVREPIRQVGRETNRRKQSPRRLLFLGASAANPMDAQRFRDGTANRPARVERGVGVLEEQLNLTAEPLQTRLWKSRNLLAVEPDAPGFDLAEAGQGSNQAALAAPRFTYQAEDFAGGDF